MKDKTLSICGVIVSKYQKSSYSLDASLCQNSEGHNPGVRHLCGCIRDLLGVISFEAHQDY